ncbi:AAA family ATPase [Anaerostipes amylophilus]|uniref:AAA family ATPase n=1 Tax=Anaerostipes amylophilus TaxID=2981779 RepID=UPI0006C3E03F|nr:AAA family ATPase [Anaerostipes amylophilus]MCU6782056.1 ATP-binding protein [Anaerostipes amylophilus]CUO41021.1 Predicted AAA-ATPase [Anaerostipes hadrus]
MGRYLNSSIPYALYQGEANQPYFVDKSLLLTELFPVLDAGNQHVCITRPRRFGKTIMANMIAAFLSKKVDSDSIFGRLKIAGNTKYKEYRNKYNVISIDFSKISRSCDSYADYIGKIEITLIRDLKKKYPQIEVYEDDSAADVLETIFEECSQERFVFVLDEWDFIFHKDFITEENKKQYIQFLSNLLKDRPYVQMTYMTGILPIAKYSDGSELNMFDEYDMACKEKYSEYFGFLDEEVDQLYNIYKKITKNPKILRIELKEWYDGYRAAAGDYLYNPRCVVCALRDNQLANYWTSSGTYDSIFNYIKGNIADVRNDIVLMVAGERVPAKMQQYAATANDLYTKDQIYSAIVNLVYLSARDEYRVEREDKAGKGFVDFIFYPKRNDIPGIILELKINHTPQEAIEQIKEKNYQLKFQGKIGEISAYEGSILAVGISYDRKTKKHSCEVEKL